MKKKYIIILMLGLLSINVKAQKTFAVLEKTTKYSSFHLNINDQKAISALFPSDIVEVYCASGNVDLLVAQTNNKILNVKSKTKQLEQTTLLVLTQGGGLYNFVLDFNIKPDFLVYKIKDLTLLARSIEDPGANNNEAQEAIKKLISEQKEADRKNFYRNILFKSRKTVKDIAQMKNSILFSLHGVYHDDKHFHFLVKLKNYGNIDFEVNSFRLFIDSNKSFASKRRLVDKYSVKASYIYPGTPKIIKNTQFFVITTPKISIDKSKHVIIEVLDDVGSRSMALKANLSKLLNSKLID
ncbi:MAG: DUF4138 domain-containing protein [Solitalea-like symbiont of Acarus siro]